MRGCRLFYLNFYAFRHACVNRLKFWRKAGQIIYVYLVSEDWKGTPLQFF